MTGSDESGLDNLWLAVGFPHCTCYCTGHSKLSQAPSVIKWFCVYDLWNVTCPVYRLIHFVLSKDVCGLLKINSCLEICALLWSYSAWNGNSVPTLRSYLQRTAWPVKMGPMGHPEPSVRNFHSTLPKSEKSADLIYSWAEAWNHAKSCLSCFFESLTLLLLVFCVLLDLNERFNVENGW